ncbi:hypothetical protein DENSPDRAFT_931856 [Dentipellis sp. KUC8613]|nr:hypothetical protein DENSPDRAFT_931856 [Dentipellis sp. KUC8613]
MDSPAHFDAAAAAAQKGDMMDFEFSLDMDHRKRRRNRTTQSCLNCHTSKRKAGPDLLSPLCFSLTRAPTTGLCVYEIDDPALRHDPNVDEGTRLRNRIAELESLVRELRGKPHPRWADANFCDGDPNEKWHSRALKRPPGMHLNLKRRRASFDLGQPGDASASAGGTPIKSEPGDLGHPFPYRFTPSPDSQNASPYQAFPPQHVHAASYADAHLYAGAGSSEPTSSPGYSPYSQHPQQSYAHDEPHHADPRYRQPQQQHHHTQPHASPSGSASGSGSGAAYCACGTNPAAAHPLLALAQQLHSAYGALRALPEHAGASQCAILRRIQELNDVLHGAGEAYPAPGPASASSSSASYDALATPPDSDIITPLSSAEAAPIRTTQIQEWHALAAQAGAGGYNPYFPPLPASAKDLVGVGVEDYHAHGMLMFTTAVVLAFAVAVVFAFAFAVAVAAIRPTDDGGVQ